MWQDHLKAKHPTACLECHNDFGSVDHLNAHIQAEHENLFENNSDDQATSINNQDGSMAVGTPNLNQGHQQLNISEPIPSTSSNENQTEAPGCG